MGFLRIILAEMRKNYSQFFFSYSSIFWFLILPFGNGLLFYFMYLPFTRVSVPFAWLGNIVEMDIVGFTLIGQLLYSFFVSTLLAGAWFDAERWQGTFEMMLLTPASRMAILLGNMLGVSIRYLWLMVGTIIVFTFSFNVAFVINDLLAVFLSFLLSYLALVAFGLPLAAAFIHSRRGVTLGTAAQEPIAFVSGLVVPQNALPRALAQMGYLVPLTLGLLAMRLTLLGGATLQDVQLLLLSLLVMAVAYVVISRFLMGFAERSAKAKGTLALA